MFILAGVALAAPEPALAQGFAINRFDPAESGSNWFSGESLDLRGSGLQSPGLTIDWAHRPLVIYDAKGDEVAATVENQINAHVGGVLILAQRVRLGVNIPITLLQSGKGGVLGGATYAGVQGGAAIGDVRVGLDLRLLGEYGDVATLAIGIQAHLPTGDRAAYNGDGQLRFVSRLMLAGDIGMLAYSARAGVTARLQDEGLGNVATGSEVTVVLTTGLRIADTKLLLGPELWGSTVISDSDAAFARATTPFELIFGGHYSLGDIILAVGVGPGLTRGLGAPRVRMLGSVEWVPHVDEKEPARPALPPLEAARDRDGDGSFDKDDACPNDHGVSSDDPAKHGCPADRDGDGVFDNADACPDAPGVAGGAVSSHGCPPDHDNDGITDHVDACPGEKGERNDDPAQHGCPGDRDRDEIIDREDACPDAFGPANEGSDKHGCPLASVEKGPIKPREGGSDVVEEQ